MLESMSPQEIERRSFAIIESELDGRALPEDAAPVIKRVIHTTADFEYADTLAFSADAIEAGLSALRGGCHLVTDTQMALAGVNKPAAAKWGVQPHCHVADPDVAASAVESGTTRSRLAVDKAASLWGNAMYVVGNAPTALMRICELIGEGALRPALVVGVPVGFVNVVESKELLLASGVPHIVARGRKGGSTVAAAICNALLYML